MPTPPFPTVTVLRDVSDASHVDQDDPDGNTHPSPEHDHTHQTPDPEVTFLSYSIDKMCDMKEESSGHARQPSANHAGIRSHKQQLSANDTSDAVPRRNAVMSPVSDDRLPLTTWFSTYKRMIYML